jgi:maintenance of morphology protein 1
MSPHAPSPSPRPVSRLLTCPDRLSFTQGLILGQLSVVLILAAFIKFFIFGDPPSPDATASLRATERRSRTLAHKQSLLTLRSAQANSRTGQAQGPLNRRKSTVLRGPPTLTIGSILSKTYYNVESHQPESLDWFNVLIAQTIAQFRSDAQHDDAILSSLTKALNGTSRPTFLDEIKVTELSLGEDFPIFSNCRVIPVDEDGLDLGNGRGLDPSMAAREGARLQARMDVDLSDVLTLALETKLLLNYPKQMSAVLPVALAVSVVRFSGTLSISFIPSNPSQSKPTTMAFNFLDDYRLDLSVRSLLGSRSRLQDVPKIAQLIESRLHRWFDERCVEPRFQEIALPNLWPRKKNTRCPEDSLGDSVGSSQTGGPGVSAATTEGNGMVADGPGKTDAQGETDMDRRHGRDMESGSIRLRRRPRDQQDDLPMPGGLPGMGVGPRPSESTTPS